MGQEEFVLEILGKDNYDEWFELFLPTGQETLVSRRHVELTESDRQSGRAYHFLIKNEEKKSLGSIGVFNISRGMFQSGLVDFKIVQEHRRKGVATIGLILLEKFCFEELGLKKIVAYIDENNTPSLNLIKKQNYTFSHQEEFAFFLKNGGTRKAMVFYKISPKINRPLHE